MDDAIREFQGQYRWLSSFWKEEGLYYSLSFLGDGDDNQYDSIEHAYQAAKNQFSWDRSAFTFGSASEAKRRGRIIKIRPDWEPIKYDVMKELVHQKFQNPRLRDLLLDTGDRLIMEGNWWGDEYWGVNLKTGHGHNHLGIIIMDERDTNIVNCPHTVCETCDKCNPDR